MATSRMSILKESDISVHVFYVVLSLCHQERRDSLLSRSLGRDSGHQTLVVAEGEVAGGCSVTCFNVVLYYLYSIIEGLDQQVSCNR